MKTIPRLLAILTVLLTTGRMPAASTAPAPAAPAVATPAPAVSDTARITSPSYVIAGSETLDISVYGEPDLSKHVRVDAKGYVNLDLVNEVKILGLTVSEAEKTIEKAYRDQRFLRNAQVTILVTSYRARVVSIQGEVKAPGRYDLTPEIPMTVADLVMKAGGFTDKAKGNKVRITRFSSDGKQTQTFIIDVESIIEGRMDNKQVTDNSMVLQPDDIVYVDESIF